MHVGAIEVHPIYDGNGVIKATEFFVNTSPEDWAGYEAYVPSDLLWDFPVGGYLVRSNERVVLVDVGLGPHTRGFMSGGAFLEGLGRHGVSPEDITDIVLTHLHADHFGWLAVASEPVFRNAVIRCHREEWAYFVDGEGRSILERPVDPLPGMEPEGSQWIDKLLRVADSFEFWTEDGEVVPGIYARSGVGHTPGSSLIIVASDGHEAVIVGDAIHCPVQFSEPDWQPIGDVDPAQASDLRRTLAAELAGSSNLIGGPHFPALALGTITQVDNQYEWTKVIS